MKKKISIFIISLFIIISLASCNNKGNENIKAFIRNLEESSFDNQGYSISFNQNYSIICHMEEEKKKMDYSINYEGNGLLEIILDDDNLSEFASLIDCNKGYIHSVQKEKYEYDYKDVDKIADESKEEKKSTEYNKNFVLKYDEDNYYLSSKMNYIDNVDNNENYNSSYNGKIAKNLMKQALNDEDIERFNAGILTMDGRAVNELVQAYAEEMFVEAKNLDDKGLNSFIKNNSIAIKEDNDILILNFKINSNELNKYGYDLETNNNEKIIGEMKFNKSNNKLISFQYDLKDYYREFLNVLEDINNIDVSMNEYIINGKALDTLIDDIKLDEEFKEYDNYELFFDEVLIKAIPSFIE